jgi:hypothetical protein
MPVDKPVNKAMDKTVNAAAFVYLMGELGPHNNEAAASAQMQVDEAIDEAAANAQTLAYEAIDTTVFVELGGELGPLINKATASAQMPVTKAINKAIDAAVFVGFVGVKEAIDEAAKNAHMMSNKAIDEVVVAGPRGSCQGCCAASATGGTQQSNRDKESERRRRMGA